MSSKLLLFFVFVICLTPLSWLRPPMPTPPVSRNMASMMKRPSNPDTRPSPIGSLTSRLPWSASTKHAS
eukprot:12902215-Prorocentrum_lima.AAC.1